MADYWKSQAKKFCDFCKCWIADNKPSIGYHESGKKHKENVTKRLAEISKNSAKSHQESVQVDLDMKKMEEEALKAYMKDLQENPDYTSQKILEDAERKKKELEESVRKQREVKAEAEVSEKVVEPEPAAAASSTKLWHEAKSDEGYTYYWNINTSESVWEPPAEGFVSIEEQEKQAKIKEEMKKRKKEEKAKRKEEELKALKERESTKKKKKKNQDTGNEESTSVMGPAPKPDPYGGWTVIEPKVEEPLDLELPHQEFVAIKVPELTEPEVKFKEKTIGSLETDETKYHGFVKREHSESAESFKRRKLNRGNARQKLDTD